MVYFFLEIFLYKTPLYLISANWAAFPNGFDCRWGSDKTRLAVTLNPKMKEAFAMADINLKDASIQPPRPSPCGTD